MSQSWISSLVRHFAGNSSHNRPRPQGGRGKSDKVQFGSSGTTSRERRSSSETPQTTHFVICLFARRNFFLTIKPLKSQCDVQMRRGKRAQLSNSNRASFCRTPIDTRDSRLLIVRPDVDGTVANGERGGGRSSLQILIPNTHHVHGLFFPFPSGLGSIRLYSQVFLFDFAFGRDYPQNNRRQSSWST
jgi:hypothetical protein